MGQSTFLSFLCGPKVSKETVKFAGYVIVELCCARTNCKSVENRTANVCVLYHFGQTETDRLLQPITACFYSVTHVSCDDPCSNANPR